MISINAGKYGVNEDHLRATLDCESLHFTNKGQSKIPHKGGPRGREDSWGLAQIHLPDHPEITKAQAVDPAFAIDWTAKQFANGHADRWTCWRQLYQ